MVRERRFIIDIFCLAYCLWATLSAGSCLAEGRTSGEAKAWTESFNLEKCTFSSTGRNPYFILQPGYRLTLEGLDDDGTVGSEVAVLGKTVMMDEVESGMY